MENNILIVVHIITTVMYGITLTSAIEKKKYLQPFIEILIIAFCLISIISQIRELILNDFNLDWTLPQWYFNRIMACVIIMFFMNRVVSLKKQIKKDQDEI